MKRGGQAPSVSIRVNPDVQAGGHPHISTGYRDHKFGLDWNAARKLYANYRRSTWIQWHCISAHIGSQITALPPFQQALGRLAGFVRELRALGIALKYLDFGGGLGVRYTDQKPPARLDYARMVARIVKPLGIHLLLEPGRTIIAPAGILLTRVLYSPIATRPRGGRRCNERPLVRPCTMPSPDYPRHSQRRKKWAERRISSAPVCKPATASRNWPWFRKSGDVLANPTAGASACRSLRTTTPAAVPWKSWSKASAPVSSAAAKRLAIFSAATCSPNRRFLRLAPLQLAPQNLVIRFAMRLNQLQSFFGSRN